MMRTTQMPPSDNTTSSTTHGLNTILTNNHCQVFPYAWSAFPIASFAFVCDIFLAREQHRAKSFWFLEWKLF